MAFILVIFWWGPNAAELRTIPMENEPKCEAARVKVIKFDQSVGGKLTALCLETK